MLLFDINIRVRLRRNLPAFDFPLFFSKRMIFYYHDFVFSLRPWSFSHLQRTLLSFTLTRRNQMMKTKARKQALTGNKSKGSQLKEERFGFGFRRSKMAKALKPRVRSNAIILAIEAEAFESRSFVKNADTS